MTNPRTPGRPRKYAERMPRVTVRLDEETRKLAREIGNTNLSLGLRIAVAFAASKLYTELSPAGNANPAVDSKTHKG